MTRDEIQILRNRGIVEPTTIFIPFIPNPCVETPINTYNEGVPLPPRADDYNSIPISDIESLSPLRKCDSLHQMDLLAAQHSKGKTLKAIAKVQGNKAFAKNYSINL